MAHGVKDPPETPSVDRLAVAELAFGLGLSGSGQLGFQLPWLGVLVVISSYMEFLIKFRLSP